MKNSKTIKGLDFNKKSIVELNDAELFEVDGATHTICLTISLYVAATIYIHQAHH